MAVAAIWFLWAVYSVMGAIALIPSAYLKSTMGPVLMWSFCGLYVVAGLACLISPGFMRETGRAFLGRSSARIAGFGYMVIGAALFRVAGTTSLPLLAEFIGVGAFIKGGVQLLLPVVAITVIEWWRDLPASWFRMAGVASLLLAALFAYGTGSPRVPAERAASDAEQTLDASGPTELPAVLTPNTPTQPPMQ